MCGAKHWIRCLVFILLSAAFQPAAGADIQSTDGDVPSLISSIRIQKPLDFCGEPVPLDNPEVRERMEKELLLNLWDRPQVILWLKRAGRYMPYIVSELKKAGLPEDLKYIPIIESALRPHAGSSAGAVGYWQFIKTTGQNYGLTIDAKLDERRNIFKSTPAAIRYFKDLYGIFGSWTLSAAAYNMGEKGLQSEMLAQEVDDYYLLYLPLETQRYIFRALSAKLILTDPKAYGFALTPQDHYAPIRYDLVEVDCRRETSVLVIAKAAQTHFKVIKDLNPDIRGHYISEGKHRIMIPEGKAAGFQERFQKLAADWQTERERQVYIVQPGDSLSGIARKFQVPLQALLIWNRIDMKRPIHPGDRLVVHSGPGKEGDAP